LPLSVLFISCTSSSHACSCCPCVEPIVISKALTPIAKRFCILRAKSLVRLPRSRKMAVAALEPGRWDSIATCYISGPSAVRRADNNAIKQRRVYRLMRRAAGTSMGRSACLLSKLRTAFGLGIVSSKRLAGDMVQALLLRLPSFAWQVKLGQEGMGAEAGKRE
jgi:hypothetical protein